MQRKTVLTTGKVAKICQVAPRTVSKWFDAGQLKGYRIPGSRDRRIPVAELIRFLRAHGMPLGSLDTGKTRVLVVDPDARRAQSMVESLSERGPFEAAAAASAFAAGMLTERFEPHVIVVDQSAAGTGGKPFSATLRSHERLAGAKTVCVLPHGAQVGVGESEGFDARLRRPLDVRELMSTIDELVGAGRS